MDNFKKEIKSIISKWNGKSVPDVKDSPYWTYSIIRDIVMYDDITNIKEWKKYFKVVKGNPSKIYGGCFCNALKEGKKLGNGAFGEVFLVDYPCKQYGRVAIKVEPIDLQHITQYQFPKYVYKSVQLSNKAAKLHLGPHIYEAFLCVHDQSMTIIKIMEYIEGDAYMNVVWKSPAQQQAADKEIIRQLKELNHHSIIHSDIHNENIMVNVSKTKPVVTIIDFDRASDEPEARAMEMMKYDSYINELTNYVNFVLAKKRKPIL